MTKITTEVSEADIPGPFSCNLMDRTNKLKKNDNPLPAFLETTQPPTTRTAMEDPLKPLGVKVNPNRPQRTFKSVVTVMHSRVLPQLQRMDDISLASVAIPNSALRAWQSFRWVDLKIAMGAASIVLSYLLIVPAAAFLQSFTSRMQIGGAFLATWYMGCLSKFPVWTKATTSAGIGWIGDTAAQVMEERLRILPEMKGFTNNFTTTTNLLGETNNVQKFWDYYDVRRGIANVADGIFVTGPLLHYAYNLLEWMVPVSGAAAGLGATMAAMTQVFIDDFILDALFVGILFLTTGLGEGYRLGDVWNQLRKDYVGAVKTSWMTSVVLMPMQFCLFRFFPLSVRVLGMNLIDVFWEGMVSFMVHRRRRRGRIQQIEEAAAAV